MSARERIRREVAEIWRQVFDIPAQELDEEEDLFVLGGTSLQAVQLMGRIEEEFDVRIPLTVVFTEGSVRRLTELIEEELLAEDVPGQAEPDA